MSRPDDGGPAFPVEIAFQYEGMSLRDYFAAQALAGHRAADVHLPSTDAARLAYLDADAMLAEREKGGRS